MKPSKELFSGSENGQLKCSAAMFTSLFSEPILLELSISLQSDVWAFGVVLWETFSLGCDPYPVWSNAKVFQEVRNGFRLARPEYSQFPEDKPMDTIYKV